MNRERASFRSVRSMRLWLTPGMGVKRHVALATVGGVLLVVGVVGVVLWALNDERQEISAPIEAVLVSPTWNIVGGWLSLLLALVGVWVAVVAVGRLNRSLLSNWMPRPADAPMVLHKRLSLARGPRIVAFGGGTGLSNLLRGLREYTSNLTAVVTVSDDGGSSGRLRLAFDMPAPGDLTDCLAALSDNEVEVGKLLQYRFERGKEFEGHTFGNLLITTLMESEGDFGHGIRALNRLLNLSGAVYPGASRPVALAVVKADGHVVLGESRIRECAGPVTTVRIEPEDPGALPEVLRDVQGADLIVLGPGSLFTSTIPPVLVPETRTALQRSDALLVYVANIMTEAGETDDFDAFDHVEAIERHLGRRPDVVVLNSTPIDDARLIAYRGERADVVDAAVPRLRALGIETQSLPLLGPGPAAQHDSLKLADWLVARARRHATRPKGGT